MPSLSDLLPGGAILDIGKSIIERVVPDKNAQQQAKIELDKAAQAGEFQETLGQIQINIEEAKSSSVFVSGWRPAVGWVCGAAFGYVAIIEPLARFVATVLCGYSGVYPSIDTNLTIQVLMGMLGLGALRSYDKKNGTAS